MSGNEGSETQQGVVQTAGDERRFCSSCGRTKPVLGGALVRCANGAKRWKCADCRAKSKAHQAAKAAQAKEGG